MKKKRFKTKAKVHGFSPVALGQVYDDRALSEGAESGGKPKVFFHYVVDAFDLINYCYPFTQESYIEDKDRFAFEQLGMLYLIRGLKAAPILLDVYRAEIEQFRSAMSRRLDKAMTLADQLADSFPHFASLPGGDPRINHLVDNSNVVLAVANNFLESASDRLLSVTRRLQVDEFDPGEDVGSDREPLAHIIDQARPGPLAGELESRYKRKVAPVWEQEGYSALKRVSQRRTIERDAVAIDRILTINRRAHNELKSGRLRHRHLFLYVSSAYRSRWFFSRNRLIRELPRVGGDPFPVWRTPYQLFVQAAMRELGPEALLDLIVAQSHLGKSRPPQNVEGPVSDLMLDPVDRYRLSPKELRREALNAAYMSAQDREDFERFSDGFKSIRKKYRTSVSKDVVEFLKMARRADPHLSAIRAQTATALFGAEALFLANWVRHATELASMIEETSGFMAIRDSVVSSYQRFPVQVRFGDGVYRELMQKLSLELQKAPPRLASESAVARLVEIADAYFGEKERSLERDLFLYVFFLVLPTRQAPNDAQTYIEKTIRRIKELRGYDWWARTDLPVDIEPLQEYQYVYTWVCRHDRDYPTSFRAADEGACSYPHDPRFVQGRYLALYSWMADPNHHKSRFSETQRARTPSVMLALRDAERSVELAWSWRERHSASPSLRALSTETLLACLNNAAYFCAFVALYRQYDADIEDLTRIVRSARLHEEVSEIEDPPDQLLMRAREYLIQLRTAGEAELAAPAAHGRREKAPKYRDPDFPAYHHTEAFVEYAELRFHADEIVLLPQDVDVRLKWEQSLEDIAQAIDQFHPDAHSSYVHLQKRLMGMGTALGLNSPVP